MKPNHEKVLAYLQDFYKEHDELPTQDMIAKHLNVKRQRANQLMRDLDAMGHVKRYKNNQYYYLP